MEKSDDAIHVLGLCDSFATNRLCKDLKEDDFDTLHTCSPTPIHRPNEEPEKAIARLAEEIEAIGNEIRTTFGREPNFKIIGRSYGGFVALMAAVQLGFKDISSLVTVEAPLNPEEDVNVPIGFPPFHLCSKHYRGRVKLAEQGVDYVEREGGNGIVMIQSPKSEPDVFVPIDAQILPVDSNILQWPDNPALIRELSAEKPLVVKLQEGLGRKFIKSYRSHVLMTKAKRRALMEIILAA